MAVSKSCQGCPSYLMPQTTELRDRFGRETGGPMCGRFGHMLGSSHSTPEDLDQIGQFRAATCDGFGQPMPAAINWDEYVGPVVSEQRAALVAQTPDPAIRSCNNCRHSIGQEAMYAEHGWVVPLCTVFGKLIIKPVAEARDCEFREGGPVHGDDPERAAQVDLVEWLRDGFKVPQEELIKQFVQADHDFIDPQDYPSDREVTEAEAARGIRAIRRIFNPEGTGEYADLPIFNLDAHAPEDRLLVPQTGDENHPELYIDYNNLLYQYAVDGVSLHETAALVGPPGVGKTQFGVYLAWLCQVPFVRIQFQRTMDVEDLLGSKELRGGETLFDPGQLPEWYTKPCVLFLDEPNLGPDEAWHVVRPLSDGATKMWVQKLMFKRDPYNMLIMGMNPSWDARNIGTNELADADGNRLSFLLVEQPPEAVERHLIKSYCKQLDDYDISDEAIDLVVAISEDIKAMSEQGTYPATWATRQMIKVARKTRFYSVAQAFKNAALNNLEPETRETILNLIATHVSGEVRPKDVDPPF